MPKTKTIKDPMGAVLANIEKQMGRKNTSKPMLSRYKDIKIENVPVISFGLSDLDKASYSGGVPRGKMVEIFGHESSGKSLLSYFLISSAQKQGLECALIDIEQSFDPIWGAQHGIDIDNMVWGNDFDSGEQALEYAYQLCKSKAFGLIVIDSTAALTPLSELEGTLEDNARVGEQARLMSRGCRKIRSACGSSGTTCIFINQIRMKIGVKWGNPETTPGGRALKFYSDMRIKTYGKSKIKIKEGGEDKIIGQISSVTFVKNKVGRPFGQAEFKIIFDPLSLNPVVMLCNSAKNAKLIRPYKGILRMAKGVFEDSSVDTGTTTMIELADYLIANNKVLDLLTKLEEAVEEEPDYGPIDEAIIEMKEDATKIISPSGALVEAQQVEDIEVSELGEEIVEIKEEDIAVKD